MAKDRDTLLAFYDVPAEHWQHVRSTNPIESTFATVRLRTNKTKGCLSRDTALAMVFKLVKSAECHWRRLNGTNRLGEIINGIKFRDGEPIKDAEDHAAAGTPSTKFALSPSLIIGFDRGFQSISR